LDRNKKQYDAYVKKEKLRQKYSNENLKASNKVKDAGSDKNSSKHMFD